MLTIKPEENFEYVGKELEIEIPGDSVVMVMADGDDLMGAGIMRLEEEICTILDICIKEEFCDFQLEFGMGKALLNTADLRGAHYAVTNMDGRERLLCALRFKNAEDLKEDVPESIRNFEKILCLEGYFDSNCSNCTKE